MDGLFHDNANSYKKLSTVGFFTRNNRTPTTAGIRLPPDFAQTLRLYGRREFDPVGSGIDLASLGNGSFEYELYTLAQPDHDAFIRAVAATAMAAGGWALYGGERAVWQAVGTDVQHPDYLEMLDAAIQFVREQGYGMIHLPPYQIARWNQTRGQSEGWHS